MPADVLVIGAGPAGLASAYYLQRAGIACRIVERAATVGATWAAQYPSLRLNTTRFYSHLPDFKMPLTWGIFPTGRQYYQHLLAFAAKHRFAVEMGVTVQRVAPEDGGWRVESSAGSAWFRAVILATGRFSRPVMPDLPGLAAFCGRALHASAFRTPEPFAESRVLVVGNGPTGVDVAIAIGGVCRYPALMSVRTGLNLKPRYPFGLPKHAWLLLAERLPPAAGERLLRAVDAQRIREAAHYGLKPDAPDAVDTVRGREILRAIGRGQVRVVDAPAQFTAQGVELVDGSQHTIDTVILATGYEPVLYDYLDAPYATDANGWPLRDVSTHPNGREVLGHRGLYLVGVFYKGKGALYNCNAEAAIAAAQIRAQLEV